MRDLPPMDITGSKPETITDLEQEALSGFCDPQAAELFVRQGRLLRLAAQLKALTRTFCAFATACIHWRKCCE